MKIMVTGGQGFIGSSVVRQAIVAGHTVVNVDCLTYAAHPQTHRNLKDNPDYIFEKINICDANAVADCVTRHKPNAIMHLAAETHVDRSIDAPNAFLSTNIMGTFNVLTAARNHWDTLDPIRKQAFRFLHVSTDEVFGDLGPDDPAFDDETAYAPNSPYAASKAGADHLARAWYHTYGVPIIISNCSNNYGPFQFPEKLIPLAILKAVHGEPIPIYGIGKNIRDWLYVDDHAQALLQLLKQGQVGESYAIGARCEKTNLSLIKTLCEILDEKRSDHAPHADLITFVEDRPGHDRRYAINPAKVEETLTWSASTDFKTGLAKTVNWYLENQWWWEGLIADGTFGHRQGKT